MLEKPIIRMLICLYFGSALATAVIYLVCSSVFCFLQKREFDVDNLSKPELRMLLSVMEGELEARDLVIEALRVSCCVIVTARLVLFLIFSFVTAFVLGVECC